MEQFVRDSPLHHHGMRVFCALDLIKLMNDQSEENNAFHKMLAWLNPDRDLAGLKYNEIQRKLIRTFACRGCVYPDYEDLAQKTIELVTQKFEDPDNSFSENYVGAPIAYFLGVARYVYLTYMRDKKSEFQLNENRIESEYEEDETDSLSECRQKCLEACLKREKYEDRKLILQYYREDKSKKIEQRLQLAGRQKENLNRLRIRMCRIRKRLRECIDACMERQFRVAS